MLYFAKKYFRMYDSVQPLGKAPLFVSDNNMRATQVSADSNAGESGMLVIYIGTDDGHVLRLRGMLASGNKQRAKLIEKVIVRNKTKCEVEGCIIRSLHVSRPAVNPADRRRSETEVMPSTFVAFTDYMIQFPLVKCSIYKSKECCSVDPDCGWSGDDACIQRTARNNASLLPTSKDTDPIPESCISVGRSATGDDDKEKPMAQASAGNFLILAFFGGLLLGILIMVAAFFSYKHCSKRRRKHTINSKPKMKKVKRNESARSDEIKENVVEDRGSNYMEMTKSPEHKYPFPPSPQSSEGDHDYKKAKTKYPKKHSSPKSPKSKAPLPPESVPLVEQQESFPTKSQSPEKETTPTKVTTPEKILTPQHVPPVQDNPNTNNSNNRYFVSPTFDPPPPPLPVKESSLRRQLPQPIQYADDPQPVPRKVTLPSRKYQSFAGYDRAKPPVPQKSHLAQAFAERNLRPHSLAPPKSVRQIEDIPMPKQGYSMTPPAVRSQKSFGGIDQPNREIVIPKRRERPPSFRYNSAAPKEARSPVPVASPVVPVINSKSPDRDPLLFQYS